MQDEGKSLKEIHERICEANIDANNFDANNYACSIFLNYHKN